MYKVVSHTHACHNILFNDQLMAMESFMVVGCRSAADHVCAVLNAALNTAESAKPDVQQLKAEILPIINSVREDLNKDAHNSFYTNRAVDNLSIVAASMQEESSVPENTADDVCAYCSHPPQCHHCENHYYFKGCKLSSHITK